MRFAALLIGMLAWLWPGPARAELPTPAAMDKYCNALPGKATASHYHQPDGQMANAQVLALTPGEYATKQGVRVYVLKSKAYLLQFTEETDIVEATRGPDYMAYWAPEHPVAMGGCSLQQLSEALHRNGLTLAYSILSGEDSWLKIREAPGEEVRIPDNKIDTGYIEVYARTPSLDVLREFCKSVRPSYDYRAPDMPEIGEHDLAPAGKAEVFYGEQYLISIVPSARRVFGEATRDIFFPGGGEGEDGVPHTLGGCSAGQFYNVLRKNGLALAQKAAP